MEKKGILAIIFTFIIIVGWSFIQSKLFPPEPVKEVKKEQVAPLEQKKEILETKPGPSKESKPSSESKSASKVKEVAKKEVSVETKNYVAVLTNQDAKLKHFKLKKYKNRVEESWITIKLTQFVEGILGNKTAELKNPEPLDLINTNEEEGLPLGLSSQPPFVAGNWDVDKEKLSLVNSGENGEVTFEKELENGLKVVKRYRFHSEDEIIDIDVEVQNPTSREVTLQLGLEWIGKIDLVKLADEGNKDFGLRYEFLKNDKVEKKEFGGASSGGCVPSCGPQSKTIQPFEFSDSGNIKWFSFGGEYFCAMLIPPPAVKGVSLSVKGNAKDILQATLSPTPSTIPPQQSVKIPYRVYLGPKAEKQLKAVGVEAEKLIDFGWFTVVAKPLLWFINLTHTATKNYGIDIILISILIKLIFLPLTQISFKSMKEMQKIQPEMARLRETYKNDKARLQQEIMLLYKRRKVNPMSGCLPMVIQIPFFIALYNALQNTIEMRHAPFFLWIQDLSAKDPIYITPIIMGATMVIQQKMTPTTADPAQAKMMLLMPVVFTFMFLNFPSGLVLYWMVNNILTIGHQYYMNKK
jgi:YidC/Oxa1 family membrane protein insertase